MQLRNWHVRAFKTKMYENSFFCRKSDAVPDPEKTSLVDQNSNSKIKAISNGTKNHRDPENGEPVQGSAVKQVLASLVAQLGTINTGMAFGFSAIAIPQLLEKNSTIQIDTDQESWIGNETFK